MEMAQNCVQWEATVLMMLIFRFNPNFVSPPTQRPHSFHF